MKQNLNSLEQDFVEFLAKRNQWSVEEAAFRFCKIRQNLCYFKEKRFIQADGILQRICTLFYDNVKPGDLLEIYRFLSPIHLLVFLSYSYPKSFMERLHDAWSLFLHREFSQILQYTKRYFTQKTTKQTPAETILKYAQKPLIVLDYGCGMAHLSFEIAKRDPSAHIILLDIDSFILDFTVFRFTKHKISHQVIKITKENLYPSLPLHNLCLADEVMEHLLQPLTVFENIRNSMAPGGLLYGNFSDHTASPLHITPNLEDLRKKIAEHYEAIETKLYRKIR
jgi:hypothetical protein